jgi:hypothetical protein
VRDSDRAVIIDKIKNYSWARDIYTEMIERLGPLADRHQNDPEWLLSRLQLHWKPGHYYTNFSREMHFKFDDWRSGNAQKPTWRFPYDSRPATHDESGRFTCSNSKAA